MKIKTWIKYEESYLPPRCRKLRYNECEEYVDINLHETTADAIQLAFEDNSYSGVGKIFFYKGKLWAKSSIRDICAGGEEEYGYHTPLDAMKWWREHGSKYFRFEFDRKYYGVDTSKQAVIKQAKADMRDYLLVDGELYKRVNEPRYCIYVFGLGHNHGGTALSVDYHYNPNIDKSCYFSALQGREAVQEAIRTAQDRGDTESIPRFRADISVYMPELVKVKPQRQHGSGNSFMNTLNKITNSAPDVLSAGLLCIAAAAHEI